MWDDRSIYSHTEDTEVDGKSGVDVSTATDGSDRISVPVQELYELREHFNKISEAFNVSAEILTNLIYHWSNEHALRNEKPLQLGIETLRGFTCVLAAYNQAKDKDKNIVRPERKNIRELCKDAEALEDQLNLLEVGQNKAREDRETQVYEHICIAKETAIATEGTKSLKHEERKFPGQCTNATALAHRLHQMTVQSNELRKDREALLYEAICISDEKDAITEERDALKFEVEEIRLQCKKAATLEEQLNQLTVENNELRDDRAAFLYEALCIYDEKEAITKERDALKFEVEEIRWECNKASNLGEQLKQMTLESKELREDREALLYEAICIADEKEAIKKEKERDALKFEVEEIRWQCSKAAALGEQLKQMTVENKELRQDIEALAYEAICISEEKESIRLDLEILKLETENLPIEFGRKH
jgi:hypothetical protein